jgi:hypothetical protein
MSWRGGRGSGEQAKPGGRRGKGAERSDGEKIDRWAVARHDFEDKSLGLHFWQKYLSGERFWVVREADAMHYWAKKDSAEERREAKIRRDELDFEFVTAPVVDLTGEDRERFDSVTFSSEHLAQVLCAALRTKVAMKALVRDVKAKDDAFRMVQQSSQADGAYTNMQIAETIAKCRPAQVSNASELLSWLVKVCHVSLACGCGTTVGGGERFCG